jgi:hypothetical protein
MVNERIVVGKMTGYERLRNSANGNPRYLVQLEGGAVFKTVRDAQCNHTIENSDVQGATLMMTIRDGEIATYAKIAPETGK